ncbi:MAG: hypothetical protein HY801_09040 [Candidatus Lindowbacteria bacterium]|nr:hypothetical protein [Candidatus Lindowbacteria bacterium]
MSLTALLLGKKALGADAPDEALRVVRDGAHNGKTIAYEMDLHLPCRVSGITRHGSRWQGEATTVRLSSFGVHLMLPADAELEGDISLLFKIPAALRVLFEEKRFHALAEIKPTGAAGPGMESLGRKLVYATFIEPLKFR